MRTCETPCVQVVHCAYVCTMSNSIGKVCTGYICLPSSLWLCGISVCFNLSHWLHMIRFE